MQAEQDTLLGLHRCCTSLIADLELLQAVRTKRGASVRPGLAGSVLRLNRALLKNYRRTEVQMMNTIRGRSDDITTGRVFQATEDQEIRSALRGYGIRVSESGDSVDNDRIPALLLLLLLFRRTHVEISDDFVGTLFHQGRETALKEMKVGYAAGTPETRRLRTTVLSRYAADIERLYEGLKSGTPRGRGLENLIAAADTLGIAARELRALFERERFRIDMFSESLVWTAWSEGYRAGAVDGTAALLALGITAIPTFEWRGPADHKACRPCMSMFGTAIQAVDLSQLPAPQDVCRFGRGCRHFWMMVR